MRHLYFPIWLLVLLHSLSLFGTNTVCIIQVQDTLKDKQELYNGSIWIDHLSLVKGDQFLFDRSFLPGSVAIRGKTYRVDLRYDIYEDELQTPAGEFGILRINKELVDSFHLIFNETKYRFIPLNRQSTHKTYFNIISQGKASLYINHQKKIDKLSASAGNARFYQVSKVYLVKDSTFHSINRKKELIKLLENEIPDINYFIKNNRRKMTMRNPLSFEPLIGHYNSLAR